MPLRPPRAWASAATRIKTAFSYSLLRQTDQFEPHGTFFIIRLQGNRISSVQCQFIHQAVGIEKGDIHQAAWWHHSTASFDSCTDVAAAADNPNLAAAPETLLARIFIVHVDQRVRYGQV